MNVLPQPAQVASIRSFASALRCLKAVLHSPEQNRLWCLPGFVREAIIVNGWPHPTQIPCFRSAFLASA